MKMIQPPKMFNTILEFLFETIIQTLFVFPGAFIRWMFKGFRGSYKSILQNSDWGINALIGIVVVCAIIVVIVNI